MSLEKLWSEAGSCLVDGEVGKATMAAEIIAAATMAQMVLGITRLPVFICSQAGHKRSAGFFAV